MSCLNQSLVQHQPHRVAPSEKKQQIGSIRRARGASRGTARGRAGTDARCGGISEDRARARAERVSTALSGSGMVLKLAKSSNEPMSPSGWGQEGKRESANPGELKTGEADAKQPRQAGILQHLTTKRI